MVNRESFEVGKMKSGESFGEITFLNRHKNGANATVIADSDEVELVIIEGYYISALFNIDITFAGKFYKYLCYLLANRINNKINVCYIK